MAKQIKAEQDILLSQALEIAARQNGYENFYHVTKCADRTKQLNISNVLGSLTLRLYDEISSVSFHLEDEDKLNFVTENLDDIVAQVDDGFGDMTTIDEYGLNLIIKTCQKLTEEEPGFLDGYAHWVGALTTLGYSKEAEAIGRPVFEAALGLLKTAPKHYKMDYYILDNRPFYRLAHNLVLAQYENRQIAAAKRISKLMLKFNPNDNTGFRFLLEPLSD